VSANPQFNRSSLRYHVTLASILLIGVLIVNSLASRAYYNLNLRGLQLVATMAVRAGAEYLPSDPRTAEFVADRYVRLCGVGSNEIASTDVSADDYRLTIRLSRKVPEYISLFAFGLPGRSISVTASGQRHRLKDRSRSIFLI
jgi:hypothetical protein